MDLELARSVLEERMGSKLLLLLLKLMTLLILRAGIEGPRTTGRGEVGGEEIGEGTGEGMGEGMGEEAGERIGEGMGEETGDETGETGGGDWERLRAVRADNELTDFWFLLE